MSRRDDLRDSGRLQQFWRRGHLLLLDERGRAPINPDGSLTFLSTEVFGTSPISGAVFIGQRDAASYWASVEVDVPTAVLLSGQRWADLRTVGARLSATDCGVFTTALGVLNWHRQAVRCERCGSLAVAARAGWVRHCATCDRDEYPRVDPAVICLVHDGAGTDGSRVLLGRKPARPPGWASLPAGFVEPGESLEAGVRREVQEEVGITIQDVRYLGSQPWPFPRSLLVAFAARADAGQAIDVGTGGEFIEARWVHRDTVAGAMRSDGVAPGLVLPPPTSIAYRMLVDWANGCRMDRSEV